MDEIDDEIGEKENEHNHKENQHRRLTKEQKEIEVEEVLKNIENGTFEIYKKSGGSGSSPAWARFVKIRNAESKQRILYVQCTECKALLTYKEHGGTSHLNRHVCKINEPATEMLPFKKLPPCKISEVQSVLITRIMKFCAEDLTSCEAICDSTNFIDFLQSFVTMGDNLGNIELSDVFLKSSSMRQKMVNFKEEKHREMYTKFREAFRKEWCSASMQIQQVLGKFALIMRIQFYEKDLTALTNKVIFATSFDETETTELFLAKLMKCFQHFGGDEEDLQLLRIVTPNKQIFLESLSYNRRDCIPDIITDILNESFDISPTKETVNFLSTCTSIVQFFHESDKYDLELSSDNSTWKNKFLMVQSIHKQFNDIAKILKNENVNFNFNKRRAEEFITFIEPFVEALDDLAAVSRPTSNKIILWWTVIRDHLGTADNYSYELKHIMFNAMECFRSKFSLTIDNKMDCFLDPRYKMLKMLGELERSEVMMEVRNRLEGIIVEEDVPAPSTSTAPEAKKRRFLEYETKKGDSKALLPQKESNKSKEAKKIESRFKKYETKVSDLDQNDEITKYLKLPAMNSSPAHTDTELDIVTKFWVSKRKYLPKLHKLAISRLHTPASCGCVAQNDFSSKQHLKDEDLNDLLFIKDKL